jgi:hypothetical protein
VEISPAKSLFFLLESSNSARNRKKRRFIGKQRLIRQVRMKWYEVRIKLCLGVLFAGGLIMVRHALFVINIEIGAASGVAIIRHGLKVPSREVSNLQ